MRRDKLADKTDRNVCKYCGKFYVVQSLARYCEGKHLTDTDPN